MFFAKKSMLHILDIWTTEHAIWCEKIASWFSENDGRGVKSCVEKVIRFDIITRPLAQWHRRHNISKHYWPFSV